ncbi:MAG: putative Diguanylate cyclase/phosphodiesterase [Frankiales bacterium]|jgi:diguanylate cyclase (GGDEF)-like protein|nr:putative Diguanylate cyclase/phosphodiesterase [Frankiales bacterium]
MSTTGGATEVGTARRACAVAISVGLLAIGVALALASHVPYDPPFFFPALLLLPLYVIASRTALDFEFRQGSLSMTLTHLPLALGALVVAPGLHLAMRLGAVLVDSVLRRRLSPMKVAYNAGAAALEVGIVAVAVGAASGDGPGPVLWIALSLGFLLSDTVQVLSLQLVLVVLGQRLTRKEVLQPLTVVAFTTTVFAAAATVALSAAWTDPSSLLVTLILVVGLNIAYRGYRHQAAREQRTESLHAFVKRLAPFDMADPQAPVVLEQVRELLHSRRLDLALCTPKGQWQHLVATDEASRHVETRDLFDVAQEVASSGAPSLAGRGRSGESQRMATPLIASTGLLGVLTAQDRLGTVRGFDMSDLRLLETVGAELATAIERGRLLADLERAATTDPLTGLPNLSETTRRLAALLEENPEGVVLAAVAVDSFREVNDTLGHQVGDELLLEVTARLHRALPEAVLGRIGGGRFAVAAPATQAAEPEMFGLGLRAQVEGSAQIGAVGTHVRLSVGCVRAPEHGAEAATLIRRAETAMYSARHANGGPVLWEPAYEVKGQRKLAVVTALREALSGGAIGVAFQPKVDMTTGRVSGVEALARWTHPALGAIAPDEFIPLAEASGLMGPLTASVLRQSLTACKGWQRRAARVGVAVNVSADTVLDPGFVTQVASLLNAVGIAPDLLTLELTEGVVVSDAALAVVRMSELHALGVKLSVDDFGTGYSSLTYLKGLPVDEVKIDKGFVDGLSYDPADRAVVRAVVDIAHTLGLRVVAEGVEQEGQEGILRGLGVDEVQGYLHARPMPALEMGSWLRRREAARL